MPHFNRNLQNLFSIAQKPQKIAVGLMSGTSLDGLDIALCRFKSHGLQTTFDLLEFITLPYDDFFRTEIRQVFSQKTINLEKLCLLNAYAGNLHGDLINRQLAIWDVHSSGVDFIASHGQTIYHAPKRLHGYAEYPNATLQIGDADHIAVKTGIITISDFRQKHLAAGGEGAPLALYGDVILGSQPGENRLLLNIGGIANFTFLPANGDSSKILCTDTGPGNTLVDAACKKHFHKPYDEDGLIGLSGKVNGDLLEALCGHAFFEQRLPKTTGPELFNLTFAEAAVQQSGMPNIDPENLVATLTAFTAKTIANAITAELPYPAIKIFVSGGGAHNPLLMAMLSQYLPGVEITNTQALGIQPDAKEAILFALLGNEALCGEPIKIGDNPSALMGKFSFPF